MTYPIFFNQYVNSNHRTLCELIQALFEEHSKLLVIRVDFLYRNEFRDYLTLDVVQEHRDRLLDNRRRHPSLFGDCCGYAWSLEHGSYRLQSGESGAGWHQHFLFFFDGQRRCGDWTLGPQIARYFDTTITNGMSASHTSNLDKAKFINNGTLGIGLISHEEIDLRNNLLNKVAGYLARGTMPEEHRDIYDQYSHVRRFGCSRKPLPRAEGEVKLGRPRSAEYAGFQGGM